jgi:hypothetical protein
VRIEQWSVNMMKPPYDIHFPTLIQIIYQRDKTYYFNNKNVISIMTIMQGKVVDWADTLFKQLQKELIRWTTSHTKVMMRTIKLHQRAYLHGVTYLRGAIYKHIEVTCDKSKL